MTIMKELEPLYLSLKSRNFFGNFWLVKKVIKSE